MEKIHFYNHYYLVEKILDKEQYDFGFNWLYHAFYLGSVEPVISVIRELANREPRVAYEISYDIAESMRFEGESITRIRPLLQIGDEILSHDYHRHTDIFSREEYLRLINLLFD